MKKLILLVILAAAAWYGWKNYPQLLSRRAPGSEVVIENRTGTTMLRVRVHVGGATEVREIIEDGASASVPFTMTSNGDVRFEWQVSNREGDRQSTPYPIAVTPIPQRYIFTVDQDANITQRVERK